MSHTTRHKVTSGLGALAAVLAIGLGATACIDDTKPQKVGTAPKDDQGTTDKGTGEDSGKKNNKKNKKKGKPGADSQKTDTFAVGDRIKLGDWEFTVHKATDPYKATNDFIVPANGNRWVGVDLEVTNKGSRTETFSTLLALELKDSLNKVYDMTLTGEDVKQPDGDVAAGESRRGTVIYEVPETAKGLRIVFKPGLFDGGKATVDLGG